MTRQTNGEDGPRSWPTKFNLMSLTYYFLYNKASMRWLLLILTLCNFASFFWSVIGIFRKVEDRKTGYYRLLQVNSLSLWILGAWAVHNLDMTGNHSIRDISLLALQFFCLIIFWKHSRIVKDNKFSIVFSNDLPERLVIEGLYKNVRHPFYMIYLICYFSIAVATENLWLLILSFSILALYFRAARSEERKFLTSPLASQYAEYRKSTWMFLPKPW
jgi:protein-S-isoprenylcysteine O-methyltransferase Ste14